MSTHGHTTIRNPTSRPALAMDRGRGLVLTVTLLAGLFMTPPAWRRCWPQLVRRRRLPPTHPLRA
jgi:hypothetical protein